MTAFQKKLHKMFERELKKIVESLKSYEPESITLFGSWARGDFHEGSDIDIMLIKRTRERFLDRIGTVLSLPHTTLGVDVLVYTPEEFRAMQDSDNTFVARILKEGRIVYEKSKSV